LSTRRPSTIGEKAGKTVLKQDRNVTPWTRMNRIESERNGQAADQTDVVKSSNKQRDKDYAESSSTELKRIPLKQTVQVKWQNKF